MSHSHSHSHSHACRRTRLSGLGPAEAGPRWCWALEGPNTAVFRYRDSCRSLTRENFFLYSDHIYDSYPTSVIAPARFV